MIVKIKTLKQLFQRNRRPGNLFFAGVFLALALFLLVQIPHQTVWKSGAKWSAQPALWPAISIVGMTLFASLNWTSAFVSPKIAGRWKEISFWLLSLEYVAWFMVYVALVPKAGYLPTTIVFAVLLAMRTGYRTKKMLVCAALTAVVVVVVFKAFLQVKVPGGQVYEYLPDALRSFMLTYL